MFNSDCYHRNNHRDVEMIKKLGVINESAKQNDRTF